MSDPESFIRNSRRSDYQLDHVSSPVFSDCLLVPGVIGFRALAASRMVFSDCLLPAIRFAFRR